ncbi:MAG: thiol-disulfide oxidoreductase [Bdellovibrionales bacterium CG12_big_fil_rev_8_21_14_0_65_38_15]|nr:MAG: thiol-disulfide oxidoreductase [Bdellovibrionales bacterium CG22_combo_CG10-13_8_21_14_all_38_13]PIQ53420.1 MAG: thiol-disulfide oxidoreductase [Bdellovibrionales bacterium CG12_big_fil_rev_8_21_14_0_65_38_15]PIR30217.1 MAG: thiol-disulfide oxidoreductase [Bdellovibrionales bacterium CG11_big_fil_rev_8_21_14_0_20_38_13]
MAALDQSLIVFFDGYCNLCNGAVNFILKEDLSKKIKFAALSGTTAQKLLSTNDNSTIIFLVNGVELKRSAAVFALLDYLSPKWKFLKILKAFPNDILDSLYDVISKNRYKWFGQKNYCRMPTALEKERFLD